MSTERSGKEPEGLPSRWTPTPTLDPGADVILAFHGLMCLCRHNNGFCEVGILNTDQGHHDLAIFILEVDMGFNPPTSNHITEMTVVEPVITADDTGDEHTDIVDIRVFKPRTGYNGVKFFMPTGTPLSDPHDFRFITDLEGRGFYDGLTVGKDHTAFGPRLHISDGVFYTLCKTSSTFLIKEGGGTNEIRSIARMLGANIYLDRTGQNPGTVTLRFPGSRPITLPTAEGKRNLVLIDNSCPEHLCNPLEGDFDRYFDAVNPPPGRLQISLTLDTEGDTPGDGPCARDFMRDINQIVGALRVKAISDDSPCGAAGAGSSGSLGPEG
jgi:hypothetical protein